MRRGWLGALALLAAGNGWASNAWADGLEVTMIGPAWHATPAHHNWMTWGGGIGYAHDLPDGTYSEGVGYYRNSDFRNSLYVGVSRLYARGQFRYGLAGGLVSGYAAGHPLLPFGLLEMGWQRGPVTWLVVVAPPSGVSAAVVQLQLQYRPRG